MLEKEVVVKSITGLHARPGSDLVQLALKYESEVYLIKTDGKKVNAKEIFEILSSNINCGDKLKVKTNGSDSQEALEAVCSYIETREG